MRLTSLPSGSVKLGLPGAVALRVGRAALDPAPGEVGDRGVEVGDHQRDDGVPGAGHVLHDVEPRGLGALPHHLVLVRDHVGLPIEEGGVPGAGRGELADGDPGEQHVNGGHGPECPRGRERGAFRRGAGGSGGAAAGADLRRHRLPQHLVAAAALPGGGAVRVPVVLDVVVATGACGPRASWPISSRTWPRTEARRAERPHVPHVRSDPGSGRRPAVLLVLAGLGVLRLEGALRAAWVSVITLACSPCSPRGARSWPGGSASSSSRR